MGSRWLKFTPISQGMVSDLQGEPLYLSAQHLELPGSPEEEIGERGCGCVWESLDHSPLMTRSG